MKHKIFISLLLTTLLYPASGYSSKVIAPGLTEGNGRLVLKKGPTAKNLPQNMKTVADEILSNHMDSPESLLVLLDFHGIVVNETQQMNNTVHTLNPDTAKLIDALLARKATVVIISNKLELNAALKALLLKGLSQASVEKLLAGRPEEIEIMTQRKKMKLKYQGWVSSISSSEKAFSPQVLLGNNISNYTKVIFIDDQPLNHSSFYRRIKADTGLFPSAKEFVFYAVLQQAQRLNFIAED